MANPFEAETGQFLVLVNTEGQYSLWPRFVSYRMAGSRGMLWHTSGLPGLDRRALDRHAPEIPR